MVLIILQYGRYVIDLIFFFRFVFWILIVDTIFIMYISLFISLKWHIMGTRYSLKEVCRFFFLIDANSLIIIILRKTDFDKKISFCLQKFSISY